MWFFGALLGLVLGGLVLGDSGFLVGALAGGFAANFLKTRLVPTQQDELESRVAVLEEDVRRLRHEVEHLRGGGALAAMEDVVAEPIPAASVPQSAPAPAFAALPEPALDTVAISPPAPRPQPDRPEDEGRAQPIEVPGWLSRLSAGNPLAKIGDPDDEASKSLCALDAKISLDGNAAFRHDGWARFDDPMQADPFEAAAAEHGLHYVHLDGQVGVIGNGAGLVMSSLDAVWDAGKEQGTNVTPANFLDIGGGASAAVMSDSLSIVLSDPQVESVFINVYGGITSCEQVAKGILQAFEELHTSKPLVVRFDGNAAAEGLQILAAANNPNLHVEGTMEQAAAEAARLAANAKASKEAKQ